MFGWHKNHAVENMLDKYLDKAEECLTLFKSAWGLYLEKGLGEEFDELVEQVHLAESSCDDIRRNIEQTLYEKALIPESRGDILGLLEALDRVPNRAESILFKIQCQFLTMPTELHEKISRYVRLNCDAFKNISTGMRQLLKDTEKVRPLISSVEKEESSSDSLQREIIRAIFSDQGIAPDQRILLRDIVSEIGGISDRCENVGDRLAILLVKRLV